MGNIKQSDPWKREFRELWRREQWFLRRYEKKRELPLEEKMEELVPAALLNTLHTAFEKAFFLVFEKGSDVIHWAGGSEKRRQAYWANAHAVQQQENRQTLRAFSGAANRAGAGNLLVSGVAGVGMGALGVALPDVPLFTAMLLKSVYEMAESYGFPCQGERERLYALRVIEAALCDGEELRQRNQALDIYAQTGEWAETMALDKQVSRTARRLSEAVLYSKALQSIPVVGVAGGAVDAICMHRVQRYANIKYQKRFLIRRRLTGRR